MKRLKNFKMFEAYQVKDGVLDVSRKNLTSLDELPEGIKTLICSNNKLTSLPELPKTLTQLDVSDNSLTSLPELHEGLEMLFCSYNKLTSLPELPESLSRLFCYYNPLECLIPTKFLGIQSGKWSQQYYYPYIESYEGQKNILKKQPQMVKELEEQTKIHPKIKKEFDHLFTGIDLNLI